ncbi:MAG: FtsX-like permease family protein [Oribacterium sp.]|nr:FtsX-like permease family protein [Oribacterium sp.]
MKQFSKNIRRLALKSRASFIGAVLIIGIGIFCYVGVSDTMKNLETQVDTYYDDYGLADIFATVEAIPASDLAHLCEIPGIETVSGKLSADLRMLGPDQEELVTVHLMSYDPDDTLNRLRIQALRDTTTSTDALYLGSRMAEVYDYPEGTELRIVYDGKVKHLSYAGRCSAPDYIYSIPPGGAMIPDGEVYDIACIDLRDMKDLMGMGDVRNELGFRLKPGYRYEDVRYALRAELERYGLQSLTKRADQTSYDMVDGELHELMSMCVLLPLIFMSISVFMLYVVLRKMIDQSRPLIGTLKAMGMTDRELMQAYLAEGAIAGFVGALLGDLTAGGFGRFMFEMYVDFFNLPDPRYHDYLSTRLTGGLIAILTGIAAVYVGVRAILKIDPAQAMRSAAPAHASGRLGRRVADFTARQPMSALRRLGLRAVFRNPMRGFLIILSIAFPFSMSTVLLSFDTVADSMYTDQFEKIKLYDLEISLDHYTDPHQAAEAADAIDDITYAEPLSILTAALRADNRTEYTLLYGIEKDSRLWHISDMYGQRYVPPTGGLILNWRTADKLKVRTGDTIELSCPALSEQYIRVPVTQVIYENVGGAAYTDIESIQRMFASVTPVNTIIARIRPGSMQSVKDALSEAAHVTWVADAQKTLQAYLDMMKSMKAMIYMFALMSIVTGGILIYNISMINLRERLTELGTLQVLGADDAEIRDMLRCEMCIYFLAGLLLGLPGSRGIKYLLEHVLVSDSYKIDMHVTMPAYLITFFICLLMAMLTVWMEMRAVRRISLTEVLKERE